MRLERLRVATGDNQRFHQSLVDQIECFLLVLLLLHLSA